MPKAPLKMFKIGTEIVEATNPHAAKRLLVDAGKVSKDATIVAHIPESKYGKVKILAEEEKPVANEWAKKAPAVAVPGAMTDVSPMEALRGVGQAWQQHVVDPIATQLKTTLTPPVQVGEQTFQTASPVSDFMLDTAADPVNYVPGGAGTMLGATQTAASFAEGGEVEGAIPLDQFEMTGTSQPNMGNQIPNQGSDEPIPLDQFESSEDAYGSTGQMGLTAIEGVAHGVAGPLATLAETKLLGVPEEEILGRQKENPITHGVGQAVGIGGSMLTGVGEGALMAKAGTMAAKAAMGTEALEGATLGYKVGSEAVKQAAEMAVLSSSDEVSKMILQDPDTTADTALSNIGLGVALGAGGGAFTAGAVNPLWNATAGAGVEKLLGTVRGHLDGSARTVLPEALDQSAKTLGIELDPVMKAALSGDAKAIEHFTTLKYAQDPKIMGMIENLQNQTSESVMQSLGVPLKDMQIYSKSEAGHALEGAFKKEFDAKYKPLEEAFTKRNTEAATIGLSDDARLSKYGQILEKGMKEVGTDSPTYKLYDHWGERLLAKESIGGIDQLKTEIGNDLQKAYRSADYNTANALRSIRNDLADFQEAQIAKLARASEKEGIAGAERAGADLLNERAQLNRDYSGFAKMSNELLDHLGAGNFKGAQTLMNKIESVGPESLLNKFSVKNNADFIPFLAQNFPETLAHVQQNELKALIQPAINSAKGEQPVNVAKLSEILKKTMAGKKELAEFSLSPEALAKIEAAARLMEAMPKTKDTGTPGGLSRVLNKMPQSALAAVAMLTGHNPVFGYLGGEMAQKLGRNYPDAIRRSYLRFLGSDQPIKAEGFKAMVDYLEATAKGENMMAKGTKAIFKAAAQVIPEHMFPSQADNDKLDKQITKYQKNPETLLNATNGNVGHYMPEHQTAIAAATTRATQYLQSIKPQPHKIGPLDKEVPPQPSEVARYNRALSIANQPAIILDHIKHGTLQISDIKDLNAMYPALYKSMATKITNQMISAHSDDETIPYRTRIGISLFLGAPSDMSMQPMSIMAAQPKPQPMGQQQAGGQGGNPQRKGATSKLGKTPKMYQTALQSAESDRAGRN